MWPVHTWLPDAHVQAPTAGSVILAGLMLKMGTYGFIRFAIPLFPEAALACAPYFKILAVIGIIAGALVAMVQTDIKKLVAYSSVSHLGIVMLGIFTFSMEGITGAIYLMVAHGLSTGALFLLIGMIYEQKHTRLIQDYGGIMKVVPIFGVFFLIATLSSIGLPGLNGFVGEILILLSAFRDNKIFGVLAASGMVLGALYMLWMVQRVFFGPIKHKENEKLKDMSTREIVLMMPLVIMMFLMGIVTTPFTDTMKTSIEHHIITPIKKAQGNDSAKVKQTRAKAKPTAPIKH
jgi:NADH-quinone oxidoreductase subunit M